MVRRCDLPPSAPRSPAWPLTSIVPYSPPVKQAEKTSRPAAKRATKKPRPRRPAKEAKPPRVRLDVDERRAQLLALGLEFFSGRAYDEVSIDDIAHKAGISKGLLYHYFPAKRDLYVAALREASRQLMERTLPDESAPPLDRLRSGLDAYLAYVEQHGRAYTALMRGGIGSDAEVAAVLEGIREEFLGRLLMHIVLSKKVPRLMRTLVRGWIGFVEAASLDWLEHRDIDRADLAEMLTSLFPLILQRALVRPGARPPSP